MKWWAKAGAAKVLSSVPGGRWLHYVLQRHVTRSLPPGDEAIASRVATARRHLDNLAQYLGADALPTLTLLEFGAGWDLVVPLAYHLAGIRRQFVLDVRPLARAWLVRHALTGICRQAGALGRAVPSAERVHAAGRLPDEPIASWLADLGIQYRAPADARATGLAAASVDGVTTTSTLEHVPAESLARIFREMFRVLRPGGLMSHEIDLSDHFSHGDPGATPWHFLRYGPRVWRVINSDLIYQNRLRAGHYVALAERSGFAVVQADRRWPAGVSGEGPWPTRPHRAVVGDLDARDVHATGLTLVCQRPA